MWRLIAAVAIVFFSGVVSGKSHHAQPSPCPPLKEIAPCYCGNGSYSTTLYCFRLKKLEKFKSILQATKGFNVSYDLHAAKFNELPSDLFEGQLCSEITFIESQFNTIGKKPFTGLENTLKKIDFYENIIYETPENITLGHLKKLEFLSFVGNRLKILYKEWFAEGPVTLKELFLEGNYMEEIEDGAFASLVNLENLWLGENELKIISRSMFPRPANKLSVLELRYNKIEALPDDIFTDMPALTSVNVEGNRLKTLSEKTWGGIWDQLEEVYVEDNKGFECDERLKWIYTRNFPKIFNGKCPPGGKFGNKNLKDLKLKDFE